jgi:diaminohydroxyphosphoribosylaminopyrimidine deaminase/5-amino-6-(5-phosphoribosylamino)uracil reductase
MKLALRLARRGKGFTSPNPAVGAVVVKGNTVVGRGWHRRHGGAHAETEALDRAGNAARGATLYVNLEPCCTYGRTPPCTKAILSAGVKRVVVAMCDPNPRHNGRSIRILRRHNVRVDLGICEDEALRLNEDFEKYIRTGLPFTVIKAAMTLDGKIATAAGDARWITGTESRAHVHRLRLFSDAVLVGRRTAERDNPALTARRNAATLKIPRRIVVSRKADISLSLDIFRSPGVEKTIIAVPREAPRSFTDRAEALGAVVLRCPPCRGGISFRSLWRRLGALGIMSILVEGGGETIASVLEADLADRVMFFIAPKIIGGRDAPTPVGGTGMRRLRNALPLMDCSIRRFDDDFMIEGRIGP